MPDQYLAALFEEAARVAAQDDQIVRSANRPAHEYLRYAVLRILEGEWTESASDVPVIDGVTVGYGSDEAMYDTWHASVEWWETVSPQDACTRFRVFFPVDYETVPRGIVDVMAALGAWRVWTGDAAACGSYDHRERREVHYLWPEDHPVEARLRDRLSSPEGKVASDGGEAGDVRDRMVVVEDSPQQDGLEPRTKRAVDEAMDVSLLAKGGRYAVRTASGTCYEVDVASESCTCPDWQQRAPDGGCKHLRRVDYEIKQGRIPRPDGRLPAES